MDPVTLEKAFVFYLDVKIVALAHLYGMSVKTDELISVISRHHVILVEDAAESMGLPIRENRQERALRGISMKSWDIITECLM